MVIEIYTSSPVASLRTQRTQHAETTMDSAVAWWSRTAFGLARSWPWPWENGEAMAGPLEDQQFQMDLMGLNGI